MMFQGSNPVGSKKKKIIYKNSANNPVTVWQVPGDGIHADGIKFTFGKAPRDKWVRLQQIYVKGRATTTTKPKPPTPPTQLWPTGNTKNLIREKGVTCSQHAKDLKEVARQRMVARREAMHAKLEERMARVESNVNAKAEAEAAKAAERSSRHAELTKQANATKERLLAEREAHMKLSASASLDRLLEDQAARRRQRMDASIERARLMALSLHEKEGAEADRLAKARGMVEETL